MKEFFCVLIAVCLLASGIVAGVYYLVEVRPCVKYGEMVGLEAKFARRCYVKRDGVWIQMYYNDVILRDELDNVQPK